MFDDKLFDTSGKDAFTYITEEKQLLWQKQMIKT